MTTATEKPQHLLALERANAVRHGYFTLRAEIAAGALSVEHALEDPRAKGSLSIGRLLMAQRGMGEERMRKMLRPLGINSTLPVELLSARRRRRIVEAVKARDEAAAIEKAKGRARSVVCTKTSDGSQAPTSRKLLDRLPSRRFRKNPARPTPTATL